MTWDVFGVKNGAPDRAAFLRSIRRLSSKDHLLDHEIGSTVLGTPFFWPREKWIPVPSDWKGNIVRGRYYDTESVDGAALWTAVRQRLSALPAAEEPGARFGSPSP